MPYCGGNHVTLRGQLEDKAIPVRIVKGQAGKEPESLEMSLSHGIAPGTG